MRKIAFFAKKSIFHEVFKSMFHDEIWLENSPWGFKNPFSGEFWYLNMFRTIFGKIKILVFLDPKISKNPFFRLKISLLEYFPAKSAEILKKVYLKFFQKKILTLMGIRLWYVYIFVKIELKPKNGHFQIFCKIPF